MGTQQSRRTKIAWFEAYLSKFIQSDEHDYMDKDKLLATFAIDNISTERTAREILNLFIRTGKVKLEGNKILKP